MSYSSVPDTNMKTNFEELESTPADLRKQKFAVFLAALVMIGIIVGGFFAVSYLLQADSPTETIRDIFIILLTFEFMLLGFALVVLLIQLARLINLLQNEIQPILESTSEAAHTLRGTAQFLSRNLVGPVMKVNSTLAGLRRAADLFKIRNKDK